MRLGATANINTSIASWER